MSRKLLLLIFACCALFAGAQQAKVLSQQPLSRWNVGTANFSGITPIGGNRYALVSDKEPEDGFFIFRIDQNPETGEVEAVYLESFQGTSPASVNAKGMSRRDGEGIAFLPSRSTVWISDESEQQIVEHALDGALTGRRLQIPVIFAKNNIYHNNGFEALCYDTHSSQFWTTTESTLRSDGKLAGKDNPGASPLLRIQSFGEDLLPKAQYAYRMDAGETKFFGSTYIYGVPALCALPNGRLLVMEREGIFPEDHLGSRCNIKIFEINPAEGHQIDSEVNLSTLDSNRFLTKRLLATWTTRLIIVQNNLANYEGMCPGIRLNDGRQTVICINDSQAGLGRGPIHLRDYLRVVILSENPLSPQSP